MSPAGIPAAKLGAMPPRANAPDPSDHWDHAVQFYVEDGAFLDAVSRSIGTALGAGNSAVVIATNEHLNGLAQRLRARGLNLDTVVKAGRYFPLHAKEVMAKCLRDDFPDAKRFEEVIGKVIQRAK